MHPRFLLIALFAVIGSYAFGTNDVPAARPPQTTVVSGTMGLTFVNGSTDSQTFNFLAAVDRSHKSVDNIHLDCGYFFSRQTTADNSAYNIASNFAFINGRYDRNVSPKLAVYGSVGFREDNPNNLSLRSLYGTGLSYNVHEGKVWKWNLSGGFAYLTQAYTGGSPRTETPSAAFGSQYNRSIGTHVEIAHTLSYIPAFSDFSNYVMTSVFSLGYQISKPLKLTINNVVDYQSDPSAGGLKKNSQWFVGLSFGGHA